MKKKRIFVLVALLMVVAATAIFLFFYNKGKVPISNQKAAPAVPAATAPTTTPSAAATPAPAADKNIGSNITEVNCKTNAADTSRRLNTTTLFYFKETNDSGVKECNWTFYDVKNKKEQIFMKTVMCPEETFFDTKNKKIYYALGSSFFMAEKHYYDLKTTKLFKLRSPLSLNHLIAISDKPKFTVRIAYSLPSTKEAHRVGKDLVNDLEKQLVEECAGKKCKVVGVGQTDSETAQVDLFSSIRNSMFETPPYIIGLSDFILDNTSINGGKTQAKSAGSNTEGELSGEEDGATWIINLDENKCVAFKTSFGDTLHATLPVYFCTDDCKTPKQLNGLTGDPQQTQISIQSSLNYLLVADEYQNTKAKIYEFDNPEPVLELKGAYSVVWFPFTEFLDWDNLVVPFEDQVRAIAETQPKDVAALIERISMCDHWANEEASNKIRQKEIRKGLAKEGCGRLASDEKILKKKYKDNKKVSEAFERIKKLLSE